VKKTVLFCCLFVFQLVQGQHKEHLSSEVSYELQRLKAELARAETNSELEKVTLAHVALGDYLYQSKLFTEARRHYQEALEINHRKDSLYIHVQNQLAGINLDLNQYEEARHHAELAQLVSSELPFLKEQAMSQTLLGSVEEKQGNYTEALHYQQTSLDIFKQLKDTIGLARSHENIGSIYEDLEKYDMAFQYFNHALNYALAAEDDNLQINIINNLGDIYRKTKRYEQALDETSKALEIATETNNVSQQVSALKDLSKTYAAIGDYRSAYQYLNEQKIANEEELVNNNRELIASMEVLYGLKEKQAELEILNKQNQLNKVQKQVFILLSVVVVLLLIFSYLYWRAKSDQDRKVFDYQQQLMQADLDRKIAEEKALSNEIEIKIASLTNYSLNLAHKNRFLTQVSKTLAKIKGRNKELIQQKLKDLISEIDQEVQKTSEWSELSSYFSQIHPHFFESLKTIASEKLSASEIRLCMLLRLNLSSKEIAEILHITSDSVRIARYRLRKKLPINPKQELQEYLLHI
jgi:tetratricopeptide (TPR) repeat protein